MMVRANPIQASLRKPLVILVVILNIGAVLWPSYRKFFVDESRDRLLNSAPVVFLPDCPDISGHFKCNDRYTLVFRKNESNQWCTHVRKNEEPEETAACGIAPDAWDFSGYWRYFNIEGVRLYYSWRGRAFIPGVGYVGWLASLENVADRAARPLSIE
jgi:hypothetical protein